MFWDVNQDDWITGNLEIMIYNNKTGTSKLIHSKKGGDGFVNKTNLSKFVENVVRFMKE